MAMMNEWRSGPVEGYAIVSEDGMLADADRVMPDSLKFEADAQFFEDGLDGVDVVVHGRHSQERHRRSPQRHRLMVTTRVATLAAHPRNPLALLWNPVGASLEDALARLGVRHAKVGVIGGTDVFAAFLDRFDVFHLTRAPAVFLPGGRPVFPEVPRRTPEEILEAHGLTPGPVQQLDESKGLTLVSWQRPSPRRRGQRGGGLGRQ